MVVGDTAGPLPKGIGHIMRMSFLATKFRDLDLTRKSILFLSPPSGGVGIIGVTTTQVILTSSTSTPPAKGLVLDTGIGGHPIIIREVMRFEELCEEYGEAFSKHNEDIGRTKLVKMNIDTRGSPPVSSRPYTLSWVQREIESLEWAGVIKKSMSNWASPIVIVPKKSAPGEPPKRSF